MLTRFDHNAILRDRELARIARWVRDSEAGWLFYDDTGRAHAVFPDEAARLEQEARRRVERYLAHVGGMQPRIFVALLIGAVQLFALHALWPAAGAWPMWIVGAWVAPYLGWELTTDVRHRIAQARWRREQAARFADRAPVPVAVEAHHRRHNLFLLASQGMAVAVIARCIWNIRHHGMEAAFDGWMTVGFVLAWLLFIPAARIDATHRRRKWLG